MAIRGFFSDTRLTLKQNQALTAVPYVWSVVYLPGYERRAVVPFLIDTGADATVLHPQDSLRLLSPDEIRRRPNPVPFGGAGGGVLHYPVEALVVFIHDDPGLRLSPIPLTLYVAEPPHNEQIESLLGRDALGHFVMHFDQRARTVTLGA